MKDYFASLQAGRGIGAVVVVVAHVTIFAWVHLQRSYLGGAWRPATVVVDFFFVLSGFIIPYVHRTDVGQPAQWWPYLYRRIIRISP